MNRLIVEPELCTGCRLCQTACSFKHYGIYDLTLSRIKISNDEIGGESLPIVCCQCEAKPCVSACPTGALDKEGTSIDKELCTGCLACVSACPNGGISYHAGAGEVLKCDLCGGEPECVRACPSNALKLVGNNLSTIYHLRHYLERIREWLARGGEAE
ncbi:MAG: 4Fe-4S dicluster domain-containing protein [Firmicutes bacterium]|nr:4Fe-4S dicluster domain-containing protein [Bacillota bacterium]